MLVDQNYSKTITPIDFSIVKDLACELIMQIFRQLNCFDLLNTKRTCRYFHVIVRDLMRMNIPLQTLLPKVYLTCLDKQIAAIKSLHSREWFIWRKGPFKIAGISARYIEESKKELELSTLTMAQFRIKSEGIVRKCRGILAAQKRERLRVDYCTLAVKVVFLSYLLGVFLLIFRGTTRGCQSNDQSPDDPNFRVFTNMTRVLHLVVQTSPFLVIK